MRVLVCGARGFLGQHVVQELLRAGHTVVAAVRARRASDAVTASGGVLIVEGDLTRRELVEQALDDVDAVVFSAGRTWQPGLPLQEYHRQNVAPIQALFAALRGRPDVRVVFTSSMSTLCGSRRPVVLREDSGREAIADDLLNAYDRAKIAAENLALQAAAEGCRVVILNPGLLLGPGAAVDSPPAAPFLLLWFCQGKSPFMIPGGATLSDVRDVARAHVAALAAGTPGQRYILGGHSLTRGEFFARVARLTGLRPPRAIPARLATWAMQAGAAAARLTGRHAGGVDPSFVRTQGLYYFGDSSRAEAELGFAVRPLDETILDTLRHYQAAGLLPDALAMLAAATPENAQAMVLLAQLVRATRWRRALLPRIESLYAACRANGALAETFGRLEAAGMFDARTARFRWRGHQARHDRRTLARFFEYAYFSSDDFLREVL